MKNALPERGYFDQLVELERDIAARREEIKEVCAEAKEADINVKALRLAVKRHLESERKRKERVELEREAQDLLTALGEFARTPLGEAAKRIARDIASGEVSVKIGDEVFDKDTIGRPQ